MKKEGSIFKFNWIIISAFLLYSCAKKEEPTPYEQVFEKARIFDSTIFEVMITDNNKRVVCENYGEACLENTGKRWLVRTIEMPVIGFESEEKARSEALRLNQYYYKNWIFDEVKGEKVLETFLQEAFSIKSAKEMEDLK